MPVAGVMLLETGDRQECLSYRSTPWEGFSAPCRLGGMPQMTAKSGPQDSQFRFKELMIASIKRTEFPNEGNKAEGN